MHNVNKFVSDHLIKRAEICQVHSTIFTIAVQMYNMYMYIAIFQLLNYDYRVKNLQKNTTRNIGWPRLLNHAETSNITTRKGSLNNISL